MRNVCYAKPVTGGYAIIGFNVPSYVTQQLPQVCSRSGNPVILLESAHNWINQIIQRANVLTETFKNKLKNLWSEQIQEVKSAREDWDETDAGTDSKETLELISQYLAYCASSAELGLLAIETTLDASRVGQMVDGLCTRRFADEIKKAGFEVPSTQPRGRTNVQNLLDRIFGMVTGSHDSRNIIPEDSEATGKMNATTEKVPVG